MKAIVTFLAILSMSLPAFASSDGSARTDPEFVGYLSIREKGLLFGVVPSEDAPARWVRLGDTVENYKVAEFKTKDETLILKKEGHELRLKLKASKIHAAPTMTLSDLVGEWRSKDGKNTFIFTEDGRVTQSEEPSFHAKYELKSDILTIIFFADSLFLKGELKVDIKIVGSSLRIEDPDTHEVTEMIKMKG